MSSQEHLTAIWEQRYATLHESRKRLARREESERAYSLETTRGVVAQIGAQRFAVPLSDVTEIIPLPTGTTGTPIPGAPPEFWGLILVRGEVRPVFDLGRLLSVAERTDTGEREDAGHVIFVRSRGTQRENEILGLRTDRVEGIVQLPESDTMVPSSEGTTGHGRFVTHSVTVSEETPLLQIIDIPTLLLYLRGGSEDDTTSGSKTPPSLSATDDFAPRSIEEE